MSHERAIEYNKGKAQSGKGMSLVRAITVRASLAFAILLALVVSMWNGGTRTLAQSETGTDGAKADAAGAESAQDVQEAVNFDHELDGYVPKKDHYNVYLTYKIVHPWWDAVALGMEDAQRQFLDRGVTVTYEYLAPEAASAEDQKQRLLEAAQGPYDVIGVDVADEEVISPVLDELIAEGKKVMTFSSSDAAEGCKRIAYVGNTHNYEDGAQLTEALCKKLDYQGKVAILVGTKDAPCHEDRARGGMDSRAQYEDMEVVEVEYDGDSSARAFELTRRILDNHEDLAGLICCNMSNPVGAARAVVRSDREVVIVGMDHDREALRFLDEGVIYCLGVQDCYSIGFDTLQTAVKIADGVKPGKLYSETINESTTIIYQDDAKLMREVLYGDIS